MRLNDNDVRNLLEDLAWTVRPYVESQTPKRMIDNYPWIFNLCIQVSIISNRLMEVPYLEKSLLDYCKQCKEIGRL